MASRSAPAPHSEPCPPTANPPTDDPTADNSTTDDPTAALVTDVFARGCPSRATLDHITGKWGTLALAALFAGNYRFNALRRRVDGISEKMLAQTLQTLERDGMVVRDVQATIPPRVEYSLTPLGRAVAGKLVDLIELVEREMPTVLAARDSFDRTA